jgi:hypothetical protein
MTFDEIVDSVIDDVRAVATDAAVIARIKRYVNEGHGKILRRPDFKTLRNGTLNFTSVASQAEYGFAQAFDLINTITQISNDRYLNVRTLDWLRQIDPGQRMSGTPTDYVDCGWQPVFREPDSTGLWIASSAAGDTTQTVRIRGIRANGDVQQNVNTTLTGTTRAAVGGGSALTDYVWIEAFTLSAAAVGVVSLYDAAAAGNELARIPIGLQSARWKIGRLWPTPSAALEYVVDGQLSVYTLVNDDDVPMLPERFHESLETYARMRWYRYLGDTDRYLMNRQEWDGDLAELKSYAEFPPSWRPRLANRLMSTGWNNLGAWYPADGTGQS